MQEKTMESQAKQDNETDKIAIIAAAIASAIWIYEQVKVDEGISFAMILCILFIISGLLYLMAIGLTMSVKNESRIRKKLAIKAKNHLFNFTIKYFWYTVLYLLFLVITSAFNIKLEAANNILAVITVIFGAISISSLFSKPQKFIEFMLAKVDNLIK